MNQLEFRHAVRQGSSSKAHVEHLCYHVDGTSLLDLVGRAAKRTFDYVSPFGWLYVTYQKAVADRLLGNAPGDLPSGRVALLVCPQCADLGCGAIGARVTGSEGRFVWSSFACENLESEDTEEYELGPFEFEEDAYREAIDAIRRWS